MKTLTLAEREKKKKMHEAYEKRRRKEIEKFNEIESLSLKEATTILNELATDETWTGEEYDYLAEWFVFHRWRDFKDFGIRELMMRGSSNQEICNLIRNRIMVIGEDSKSFSLFVLKRLNDKYCKHA